MKCIVFLFAVAQLCLQTRAYTYCSYRYRNSYTNLYEYRNYKCSTNEYCCGTHSCCTMLYARWYLWFVLITFFLVMLIIWWYYRYRYRPRQALVATRAAPVMTGTAVSCTTSTVGQTVQTYPYPAAAPPYGYPGPGNAAPFQAYNKQTGPPQGYSAPQVYAPSQGFVPPPSYAASTGYPPQ